MPSCQDIREYLPFYADDEIPAAVRPRVEAHLAECLACQREADSYRSLRNELRDFKHSQANESPSPAVWEGAVAGWNRWEQGRRRVAQARFAIVGLSLFLLLFGGAWAWYFAPTDFPLSVVIADYQRIAKEGAHPQLETPDADRAASWLREKTGAEVAPINLSLLGGRLEGASVLSHGRFKVGRLTYRTSAGLLALYVAPRQGEFENAPSYAAEGQSFFAPQTHSPITLLGWSQSGAGMGLAGTAEAKTLGRFALAARKARSPLD